MKHHSLRCPHNHFTQAEEGSDLERQAILQAAQGVNGAYAITKEQCVTCKLNEQKRVIRTANGCTSETCPVGAENCDPAVHCIFRNPS